MNDDSSARPPDAAELRRLAQAAGVGPVSAPPVRLDDLRRALDITVARAAALRLDLTAKAS